MQKVSQRPGGGEPSPQSRGYSIINEVMKLPRRPGQPRAGPACARSPRGGAAERWSARGRRWEARLPKAVFTWLAGSPGGGGGAAGAPGPRSSSQTAPPRQRGRACGPGDRGRDPEGGAGAPGPRALGARAAGGGPDPAAPAAWRDDRHAHLKTRGSGWGTMQGSGTLVPRRAIRTVKLTENMKRRETLVTFPGRSRKTVMCLERQMWSRTMGPPRRARR